MRLLPLLLLALLAGGCAGPRLAPPSTAAAVATVTVFDDGFHSGLLVPRRDRLADLDPQAAGPAATLPWLEIGFASGDWIASADPGCCTASRLLIIPSDGVLWCLHRPGPERPPRDADHPVRLWRLPLSAAAWDGVQDGILAWVDPAAPLVLRAPERDDFVRLSSRRWSVGGACHDFTADILARAGLHLGWRPVLTSSGLRGQMDEALAAFAACGAAALAP